MIEPVKLGIKADPPSLIFVYKMWGRLRMRTMPIRNLWPTTSTKFILEDIRARHEILLGVSDETITKMVDVLKMLKAGVRLEEALAKHERENSDKEKGSHQDSPVKNQPENRLSELRDHAVEKKALAKDERENSDKEKGSHHDSPGKDQPENRLSELRDHKVEKKIEDDGKKKETDGRKDKPYSFMDKRLTDEDTDFDLNDDLPLDELDGNSDDDFWR